MLCLDTWGIIAKYIPFHDGLSMKSISKEFNDIFSEKAWLLGFNEKKIADRFFIYKADEKKNKWKNDNRLGRLIGIWIKNMGESIKRLDLSVNLNSADVQSIAKILNTFMKNIHITSIDLSRCKKDKPITAKSVRALLNSCPNITSLDICGRTEFRKLNLGEDKIKKLTSLNISQCSSLNESSLWDIINKAHNLKSLDINYCKNLNDKLLRKINWSKNLKSLDIRHCNKINDHNIFLLPKHLHNLYIIKQSYINDLTLSEYINKNKLMFLDINYLNGKVSSWLTNNILQKQKKLICLWISTEIDSDVVKTLTSHNSLENIHLRSTKISQNDLETILTNPKLQKITLSQCKLDFEIKTNEYEIVKNINLDLFEFKRQKSLN